MIESLLILLIQIAIVVAVVWVILYFLPVPPPVAQVIWVIVALVVLLWVVRSFAIAQEHVPGGSGDQLAVEALTELDVSKESK